jgi:ribosome recycling factor
MNGAVSAMKSEFQALRTGRASASLLDKIMVNAYGAMTPLNQCAGINVPEPRMITVTVWDKTLIDSVDKAIRESNIGINPVGDGMILRLPIPELNEERRIELTKVAGGYAENARIAVRNVRRDGMDQVKKSDDLSEDDQKIWSDEIQELTNKSIKKIDEVLEQKQAEIMQV